MNREERRAGLKPEQRAPREVGELFALAAQHARARRLDAAIACFRKAVKIAPELAVAQYNLGNALAEHGETQKAVFCFRKAILLAPNLAAAHANLAAALLRLGKTAEAEMTARQAVEIAPESAFARFNLGTVFEAHRRLGEAASCYQGAIDLHPDFPVAHVNLAMMHLAQGDFETGWREYAWRWKTPQMIGEMRRFTQPQWQGERATGKTVLLHSEQGFGDTIQFCRYAPTVAALGLKVVLQVQPALVRLLRGMSGVARVIGIGEALPPFDFHCPLLSLPLAMGMGMGTMLADDPYLSVDPINAALWRDRVLRTRAKGLRVGLAWAGNSRADIPDHAELDRRRSIRLEQLRPVLNLSGTAFFSLQKDQRTGALVDLMPEVADFADTAALITQLDLVISVDTAVAHLAAALGKKVWLLNRYDSCWRWIAGRRDSPWYPTLRIYHQLARNEWRPVVERIAADLGEEIERRGSTAPAAGSGFAGDDA